MEENGMDDILGQMKNNFNTALPSETEIIDPGIDDVPLLNKKSSPEAGECDKADSDSIPETHSEDEKLSSAVTKHLARLSSDDEMLENESPKNNSPKKIYKHSNALSQTSKRTRRRPNSKSIIQNAIARKEKSFGIYEEPKSRKQAIKTRSLTASTKIKSSEQQASVKKPVVQKRTRYSSRDSVKNHASDLDEAEDTSIRRSQRTLASENKKPSTIAARDEDERMQAQLLARLCKCTENKQLYMESETDSRFCTAVDNISTRLVGCSRSVDIRSVPMFRPSSRVPFGIFCESHKQRLIQHNCCPTCGVFCTQGYFAECQSKHYFHKDCKISIGEKTYCPHCGTSEPSTDIVINMYSSKVPVFLPVQRSHQ